MKCSDKSNCSRKRPIVRLFLRAYDSYRELLSGVSSCCADMGEEALTEFAEIIPEYAFQKIQKFSKRDQEKYALNFNLAMVVYVVPLFIHTRDPLCEKLAEMMVEKWNQKKVTKMEIGMSDYEKISSGFKRSWFSFSRH